MNIVAFDCYFPTKDMMNTRQKKSYDYISTQLDKGKYVDIEGSISYLFLYIYEKISLLLKDTNYIDQIINDLQAMYNNYENISKISSYLLSWIGDLYCFQMKYEKALDYYKLDPSKTQTHLANRVLNIKYHQNIDVNAKDIFCIDKILTKFGEENLDKIIDYTSIILKREKEIRNRDYLQYIGDKYFNKLNKYKLSFFSGHPDNYEIKKLFYNKNNTFEIIAFYSINEFLDFAKELSRDAENLLREDKDIPKVGEGWLSEAELYYRIKQFVDQFEVIHHYNSSWLGRQHLDVFIPKLNLAFEYQGRQHFEPVEFFGGEKAFEKQKRRDQQKKRKCTMNNVKLICVEPEYDFKNIKKKILKRIKQLNY